MKRFGESGETFLKLFHLVCDAMLACILVYVAAFGSSGRRRSPPGPGFAVKNNLFSNIPQVFLARTFSIFDFIRALVT